MKQLSLLVLMFFFSFGLVHSSFACEQQVSFKKGKTQVVYQGAVTGDEYCDYIFRARADQELQVRVNSSRIETHLMEPVEAMLTNEGSFTLPQDGEYVLRVGAPRAVARKNAKVPYKITIQIQ